MENEFFLNAGIPPSLSHFESNSSIPTWQQLSSAMETQVSSEQPLDCFLNSNWDKPVPDQSFHFDSALSSMASNSNPSNESFVIRELIGKLGNSVIQTNSYTLGKSMALNSTVAEFSADPGFAERAARLSCFGSRSFNGRTTQLASNGNELGDFRSNPSIVNEKLSRVSSSPSLKAIGSEMGLRENKNSSSSSLERNELANSQEESTLSEQTPNVGKGSNPRKRKANSKGKVKETSSSSPSNPPQMAEVNEKCSPKRCKASETNGNEKSNVKTEEDSKKTDSKPPETPKDYIHVRARRGQATDSHSLAERVRREKISERMKLLQDLVPGCNKVTGKALMLDEIINYVQSLQHQVEFLSMKLASVNTRVDFNMDSLISKEMYQSGNHMRNAQISPIDSSASAFYGQQNAALPTSSSYIPSSTHCSVDHLDSVLCQNLPIQLPSLNGYSQNNPQYPTFGEDDLQTIVQMGFVQNQSREMTIPSESFNLGSEEMKVEL